MNNERLKLLIVEDEPDICTSVQSYFGKRNIAVSTTGSGHEALSMIKASKPDIVLMDISLNDLTGIEVLQKLREYDKETKVVIITGQMYPPEEIEKIYSLGVSGYRQKPLVLTELEKLVYEITGSGKDLTMADSFKEPILKGNPSGDMSHRLSNLLGIIRNKCENFTLNLEDGIYENKSNEELLEMSVAIIKEIEETVDKAVEITRHLKG